MFAQPSLDPVRAFLAGTKKQNGKTGTDGHDLYHFGNMIAKRVRGGIMVTLAGWDTKTTRAYLNNIPGVSVHRDKGRTYLNGIPWTDGEPRKVKMHLSKPKGEKGDIFAPGTAWISTDGWRGYEEPFAAICGANDTGMWSDSPCPSNVREKELKEAAALLKANGIRSRVITTSSSNVFCAHVYLVAKVKDTQAGRDLITASGLLDNTRLLYVAGK